MVAPAWEERAPAEASSLAGPFDGWLAGRRCVLAATVGGGGASGAEASKAAARRAATRGCGGSMQRCSVEAAGTGERRSREEVGCSCSSNAMLWPERPRRLFADDSYTSSGSSSGALPMSMVSAAFTFATIGDTIQGAAVLPSLGETGVLSGAGAFACDEVEMLSADKAREGVPNSCSTMAAAWVQPMKSGIEPKKHRRREPGDLQRWDTPPSAEGGACDYGDPPYMASFRDTYG